MAVKNYSVVDADSHVFEPISIWQDYLEPEYRIPARSAFYYEEHDPGVTTVIVNGEPAERMNRGAINRQAVWRPGFTPESIGRLDPKVPYPINPGANDPLERLKD